MTSSNPPSSPTPPSIDTILDQFNPVDNNYNDFLWRKPQAKSHLLTLFESIMLEVIAVTHDTDKYDIHKDCEHPTGLQWAHGYTDATFDIETAQRTKAAAALERLRNV